MYTVQSASVFEIRMITVALVKGRLLFVVKFLALGAFRLSRNIVLTSANVILWFCDF